MSATGSYARLPPDAYNRNSIGQRGGDVRVPLAQVGPSAGTRPGDPMGKQAAALIVSMSPYPLRTLRDGLVNGGRDASAIRVPLAHVTPTEAEIATRITQEAKSETPSSAMPVTLNQAIELLKAAEEGWAEEGKDDAGYAALLADAQRLKAIRAVAKRRPIRDDEQALINSLADKYSGAIETAVSDSSRRQQALIAKQADPSAQGVADADAMRADIAARFTPHDRAKSAAARQQAAAIDRLLGPRFAALPQEVEVLARDNTRVAASAAREAARGVVETASTAQRDNILTALEALQGGDLTLPPGDPGRPQSITSLRTGTINAIKSLTGGVPNAPFGDPRKSQSITSLYAKLSELQGGNPALPPGDAGRPQSLTSIREALNALPQSADMAATFEPLKLQNAQMISEMTTRGTDTLAVLQNLRSDLAGTTVQGRGSKGQFTKSTTLLPSPSISSIPSGVSDPNNIGGFMEPGQTTKTTSSPSPKPGPPPRTPRFVVR